MHIWAIFKWVLENKLTNQNLTNYIQNLKIFEVYYIIVASFKSVSFKNKKVNIYSWIWWGIFFLIIFETSSVSSLYFLEMTNQVARCNDKMERAISIETNNTHNKNIKEGHIFY